MARTTAQDVANLIRANVDALYASPHPTPGPVWDDYRQVQTIAWDYAHDRGLRFEDKVEDILTAAYPRRAAAQ